MRRRLTFSIVLAMIALAFMPTAAAADNDRDDQAPVVCIYHGPSLTDIRIRLMSNCGPGGGVKLNAEVEVDEDGITVCVNGECLVDFPGDDAPPSLA